MAAGDRPKKRFAYLTTSVIVTTIAVVGVYVYSIHSSYQREQTAIAAIEEVRGFIRTQNSGAAWCRAYVGDEYLKYFDRVECVMLSSRTVNDDLATTLVDFAGLQELDLDNTQITDAGLAGLSRLPNLRVLHLDRTAVTSDGLASLRGLPNLEELYLMKSKVSDFGLEYLARLPKLELLYLDQTQVTDVGLERLDESTNLRCLSLIGTRATKEWVARLQQKLPDCRIVFQ